MRVFLSILLLLSTLEIGYAEASPQYYKFRVYLSDKGVSSYSLDKPEEFLSHKSIERKKVQNVAIDERDIPISQDYFNLIKKAGGDVVSHSKWMSTIVVMLKDSASIENIERLSFVDSAKYVWRGDRRPHGVFTRPRLVENVDCCEEKEDSTVSFFGKSESQFLLHNARALYSAGYMGKGKTIGVIDAGFTNFDVIPYFENVDVLGYGDFVSNDYIFSADILSANDHGTKVLSTMASYLPKRFVGSAPKATYLLMRSEDVVSEFMVEEDYWVRAAEYADSVGVDIINTSLGYSSFDDRTLNYTHNDLNGNTSFMSRGADIAFEKGMMIVVSAGNEGNKQWKSLTPPGDAKKVITVGAVDTDGNIASFSSRGILPDERVKPDFVSVGLRAVTIGQRGDIGTTNGTSFATPFLTGLITSLWSVNPSLNRSELIEIMKECADRSANPDSIYGNGVIDFGLALEKVLQTVDVKTGSFVDKNIKVKRDRDSFTITFEEHTSDVTGYMVRVLDERGEILSEKSFGSDYIVTYSADSEVKKNNKYVHLVLDSKEHNKTYTYRIKL